jgi:hypothetical protein
LNGRQIPIFFWLVLIVLVSLAGCEPPGQGAKAEAGYAAARPVIAGLASYHQQHGNYPASLEALVPGYLSQVPSGPDGHRLDYRLTSEGLSYELSFRYVGPGMNLCTYTPERQWRCTGYY